MRSDVSALSGDALFVGSRDYGGKGSGVVSSKSREKNAARKLQERTDWSYSECLRCVRTMTPEAIEALIVMRGAPA